MDHGARSTYDGARSTEHRSAEHEARSREHGARSMEHGIDVKNVFYVFYFKIKNAFFNVFYFPNVFY